MRLALDCLIAGIAYAGGPCYRVSRCTRDRGIIDARGHNLVRVGRMADGIFSVEHGGWRLAEVMPWEMWTIGRMIGARIDPGLLPNPGPRYELRSRA
jgi:hypothetical protein